MAHQCEAKTQQDDLDPEPDRQEKVICALVPGSACLRCAIGKLDYKGLLNLACPSCNFELGGGYT